MPRMQLTGGVEMGIFETIDAHIMKVEDFVLDFFLGKENGR